MTCFKRDPRPVLAVLTLLAATSVLPAQAADDADRFTMTPADGGGFVRLDKKTGAMSLCTGKEGEWACKPMPETDTAMRKRLEDLEGENRALRAEKKLSEAEPAPAPQAGDTIPPDAKPGETVPQPPGDLKIPTERDVDKLFDYVEGMVRKFKERIDRLEKEAKKEPATPL